MADSFDTAINAAPDFSSSGQDISGNPTAPITDAFTPDTSQFSKYQMQTIAGGQQMGLGDTLVHGAVATIADIGTTLWNSLPGTTDVSTEDLLSRLDPSALNIYNENPDTIQAASFIGGLFIPMGLQVKGMQALRAGVKGASWFSEAGALASAEDVANAFKSAGPATEAYKAATTAMYTSAAANALVDNIALEGLINLTMNAHPYMDDYYKDFGSNFLFSVGVGGAIQGVVENIAAKAIIQSAIKPTALELSKVIQENVTAPAESAYQATKMQIRSNNIDNLTAAIEKAEDPTDPLTLTPYTINGLRFVRDGEQVRLIEDMKQMSSEDIQKVIDDPKIDGVAIRDNLINILKDPVFAEADKVGWAEVKPVLNLPAGVTTDLQDTPNLIQRLKILAGKKAGQEVINTSKSVYSPVWDAFMSTTEAGQHLTLADLDTTVKGLEDSIDGKLGVVPRSDNSADIRTNNSALVDADFAKAVLHVQDMSVQDLSKLVAAPDDLAFLKAVQGRLDTLRAAGEDTSGFQLLTSRAKPSFAAQERITLMREGLAGDYPKRLADMEANWDRYSVYNGYTRKSSPVANPYAVDFARRWVAAGPETRDSIRGVLNKYHEDIYNLPIMTEADQKIVGGYLALSHSPESKALRLELHRMADADGNVWLYRGLHGSPSGQRAIESFTTNAIKANEFGGVKLYKVHVDDIIGTMHDFGSRGAEPEILVKPSTREHAEVSNAKAVPEKLQTRVIQTDVKGGTNTNITLDAASLQQHLANETTKQVKDLTKEGYTPESISLRTGTPLQTVTQIQLSQNIEQAGLIKYGNIADIEQAMHVQNRALGITTSASKTPTGEMLANLQNREGANISDELVRLNLQSSPGSVAQAMGKALYSDELKAQRLAIQTGLDQLTVTGLKSIFFRSINSALEGFGSVGAFATAVGKQMSAIKNDAVKAFIVPIGNIVDKIVTDEAGLLELHNALNVRAANSGRTIYRGKSYWAIPEGHKATTEQLLAVDDAFFEQYAVAKGIQKIQFAGKDFSVVTPSVDEALTQMQKSGREMYHLNNSYFKSTGRADLVDRGFWTPPLNTYNKEVAYAFDQLTRSTTMIVANTEAELNTAMESYRTSLGAHAKNVDIVPKAQQEQYNILKGRHDPVTMGIADYSKRHTGSSALSVIPTDTSLIKAIMEGYSTYVNRGIERLAEVQMSPTMERLKILSELGSKGYSPATFGTVTRLLKKPVDPGNVLRNVLLGRNNLHEVAPWAEWQERTQVGTDLILNKLSNIISPFLTPISGKINKGSRATRTPEEWKKVTQEMESRGIAYPFQVLDDATGQFKADPALGERTYLAQDKQSNSNLTPRMVALSNNLAATALLRVWEHGQAFVNAVSLPILTSAAVSRKFEASLMGTDLDPSAKFGMVSAMYDGMRLWNHPTEAAKWYDLAAQTKMLDTEWRENNALIARTRSFDPSPAAALEGALDSKLVGMLSWSADKSENLVRTYSYFTGIALAKKAYPGLSDAGIMTFTRQFMDEAIGNYTAAQRPVAFQGTFGVAMGLFQTYMLTMAQHIYRQIETKDWAALGKMMLTQSTLFGTSSLPGFHPISEAIATHFNDHHYDLETGTYRALPDEYSNVLLYGLPSQLVGISTRGDIQPRLPSPTNLSTLAAVKLTGQAYDSIVKIAQAASNQDGNTGRAIMEALSLQSLSRPVARAAELINGYSITQKGDIVADNLRPVSLDTLLSTSTISRILATRPLEEMKARQAMQLNTMYGSIDADKRTAIAERLKTHIRDGSLSDEVTAKLAFEYLRTGSPTGWRSVVNKAIAETNQPAGTSVMDRLNPKSPTNLMIDDLD